MISRIRLMCAKVRASSQVAIGGEATRYRARFILRVALRVLPFVLWELDEVCTTGTKLPEPTQEWRYRTNTLKTICCLFQPMNVVVVRREETYRVSRVLASRVSEETVDCPRLKC